MRIPSIWLNLKFLLIGDELSFGFSGFFCTCTCFTRYSQCNNFSFINLGVSFSALYCYHVILCFLFVLPFNPLPNNKTLDCSILKAFSDDKLNGTEKLKFVLGRVENNVGKGETAGYEHFLLFPQCFQ